jgi:hypothetical protein
VLEHLLGLRGKIILANDIAIRIDGGLACNEENAVGCDFDDLRIAWARRAPAD